MHTGLSGLQSMQNGGGEDEKENLQWAAWDRECGADMFGEWTDHHGAQVCCPLQGINLQ